MKIAPRDLPGRVPDSDFGRQYRDFGHICGRNNPSGRGGRQAATSLAAASTSEPRVSASTELPALALPGLRSGDGGRGQLLGRSTLSLPPTPGGRSSPRPVRGARP